MQITFSLMVLRPTPARQKLIVSAELLIKLPYDRPRGKYSFAGLAGAIGTQDSEIVTDLLLDRGGSAGSRHLPAGIGLRGEA